MRKKRNIVICGALALVLVFIVFLNLETSNKSEYYKDFRYIWSDRLGTYIPNICWVSDEEYYFWNEAEGVYNLNWLNKDGLFYGFDAGAENFDEVMRKKN